MNTNYHHHAANRQAAVDKLKTEAGMPKFANDLLMATLNELGPNDTGQSVLVNASISQSPNGVSINAGVRYSAPLADKPESAK